MKLKIERISRKEVTTQRGKAWKLSILCNEEWYSAWAGAWNQQWKEGQVIDVEVKDVQSGEFTYHNIQTPKPQGTTDGQVLDEIKNMIVQLMKEVLEVKAMVSAKAMTEDEPPPPSDEDAPEGLPF